MTAPILTPANSAICAILLLYVAHVNSIHTLGGRIVGMLVIFPRSDRSMSSSMSIESSKEAHAMSVEENKDLVLRQFEAFNSGNLDALDEITAPDWVNIDPSLPPLG